MAQGSGGFAVSISATDAITPTLAKIGKELTAFQGQLKKIGQSEAIPTSPHRGMSGYLETIGRGVPAASRELRAFGDELKDLGRTATTVLSPLGRLAGVGGFGAGLGVAAVTAGLADLVEKTAGAGASLGRLSARIAVPLGPLQSLEKAMRLSGGSAESMDAGLGNLGTKLHGAAWGQDGEAIGFFKQFNVAIKNADGSVRSAQKVLPELAEAISKIADPYAKAKFAQEAFGDAWADFLPLFAQGKESLDEFQKQADKFNVAIGEDGVKASTAFKLAQTQAMIAVEGLGTEIGLAVLPVLRDAATEMAKWTVENRKWIADDIGGAVKSFSDYIRTIDWKATGVELKTIGDAFVSIAQAVKAVNDAFTGDGMKSFIDMTKNPGEFLLPGQSTIDKNMDRYRGGNKASDEPFSWLNPGSWFAGNKPKTTMPATSSGGWFPNAAPSSPAGTPGPAGSSSGPSIWKRIGNALNPISPAAAAPMPGFAAGSNEAVLRSAIKAAGGNEMAQAGLLSNFDYESGGLNPRAHNASGATGVAQWIGSRFRDLQALGDPYDIHTQAKLLYQELTGKYKGVLERMNNAGSPPQSAELGLRGYEGINEQNSELAGAPWPKMLATHIAKAGQYFSRGGAAAPAAAVTPAVPGAGGARSPFPPQVKYNSKGNPYELNMTAQEKANVAASMATIKGSTKANPWYGAEGAAILSGAGARANDDNPATGGGAGQRSSADDDTGDTSHRVQIDINNAPAGTRAKVAEAQGPAEIRLRTGYAMAGFV